MKWDISYWAVITAGFCQMQLWWRIHWLQLRVEFGWLFLSTLWCLHKVRRIKRVNVLDLFKEEQLPVEVQNDLSVMYLVQTVISLRLLQGRKMNSLINPECWVEFTVGSYLGKWEIVMDLLGGKKRTSTNKRTVKKGGVAFSRENGSHIVWNRSLSRTICPRRVSSWACWTICQHQRPLFFPPYSGSSKISLLWCSNHIPALHLNNRGEWRIWLPEESVGRRGFGWNRVQWRGVKRKDGGGRKGKASVGKEVGNRCKSNKSMMTRWLILYLYPQRDSDWISTFYLLLLKKSNA